MKARYSQAVDETKRRLLVRALKQYPNCRAAAKWLGVSAATVSRDCRRLGITVQTTTSVLSRVSFA